MIFFLKGVREHPSYFGCERIGATIEVLQLVRESTQSFQVCVVSCLWWWGWMEAIKKRQGEVTCFFPVWGGNKGLVIQVVLFHLFPARLAHSQIAETENTNTNFTVKKFRQELVGYMLMIFAHSNLNDLTHGISGFELKVHGCVSACQPKCSRSLGESINLPSTQLARCAPFEMPSHITLSVDGWFLLFLMLKIDAFYRFLLF